MADFGAAAGALFEVIGPVVGPLVKRALAAFVKTTAGMITLGVISAVIAYAIAGRAVWWHGAMASLVSMILFAGLGVYLAGQRAVGGAIIAALAELGLGKKLLGVLFGKLLAVHETEVHAERGVTAARTAERLPLRRAEELLTGAVDRFVAASAEARGLGAWIRRHVEVGLVRRIELVTLARFRDAEAKEGGVDLIMVRDELATKVDALAADQVRAMMTKMTLLVLLGASLGSVAFAVAVEKLFAAG